MKTKFFMTALALPLAFAACTNEDVFTSAPGAQGETLTVAVTRSGYDADTKAAWVDEKSGASFEWTTVGSDKIGLALLNPADASKVVTNYEMSLIGWSNANGKGAAINYSQKAQNGVKYTTDSATAEADDNAGSGVFQATGLTVMDGNYIVYHPYNKDFAKAGYMAVDFKTKQTADLTTGSTADDYANLMLAAAGNNAFSYSLPKAITKGGQVESDFATRNLSALVKLALTDFGGTNNLEKVILLEDTKNFNKNSNGFLKSAHLNAEKIKTETGINTLESPVYTSMVTLAFNPGTLTGLDDANIYMVAGPRSSSNQYSILLINDQNLASIWNASVNFTAGNKSTINIKYNSSHDFETLIVTDGDDLKNMLQTATTYDGETIYILGDLTVTDLGVTTSIAAKDVTIKAYGENPETSLKFVASGADVTIKGVEGADEVGLKFDVPVTTEIKNNHKITLDGTTSFTDLTNNGTLAIAGKNVAIAKLTNKKSLTINAGAELNTTGNVSNTSAGTIEVAASIASSATNGGTWNIGEGTTLTNAGEINNYFTINNFGTIDNENGTYVQKLQGKFIGQYDIAADKRGNYVIEVNSNDQFLYANGTTCTTIRVVEALINATINNGKTNILKNLKVEKRVELTGNDTNKPKLELDNTELNGGLYIINNNTTATISGTAYASTIVINAASPATATAPHLTIEKESIIKAGSIVNNGTGSIKEGETGIPADVKTLSSTGKGSWDNYPQVVAEL